jgi:hypothetical protein
MDITTDQPTVGVDDRDEPVITSLGNPRRVRL